MSKKIILCGCTEPGCTCQNTIEVFEYVPDGAPIQCEECLSEHSAEAVESTGI